VQFEGIALGSGNFYNQYRSQAVNDFLAISVDLAGDCVGKKRNRVDGGAGNLTLDTAPGCDGPNGDAFAVPLNIIFELDRINDILVQV
jgi:hypothetical protein